MESRQSMLELQTQTNDDLILTDISNKANKKISYIQSEKVIIQTTYISSWNFCQKLKSLIKDIFLPKGYPESVSSDYLEYQVWDTCQAFCSSICGTLTLRSVMQGIGVGSEAATPVSAAVTWIMKDGTGMFGSILFAWLKGSKLDSDCKKWRLFADVLNDMAMFTELCIPFIIEYSMFMLCVGTIFKALVGTAGSSTRAAVITHQAKKDNIADVSAKDGSQEIFTNLFALVFGIILLRYVTDTKEVWTVMLTAATFHLIFNYKAVRCLNISVFNSERFHLTLRTYLPTSVVPKVEHINQKESVFLFRGMSDADICGFFIVFGACLKSTIEAHEMTGFDLANIVKLFQEKKYFLMANLKKNKIYVTFRTEFRNIDVLKAYFHALILAISLNYLLDRRNLHVLKRSRKNSPIYRLKNILNDSFEADASKTPKTLILQAYLFCNVFVDKEFVAFCKDSLDSGWILNKHLIYIDEWRAEWISQEPAKDGHNIAILDFLENSSNSILANYLLKKKPKVPVKDLKVPGNSDPQAAHSSKKPPNVPPQFHLNAKALVIS